MTKIDNWAEPNELLSRLNDDPIRDLTENWLDFAGNPKLNKRVRSGLKPAR
jgi:hypothetical protein